MVNGKGTKKRLNKLIKMEENIMTLDDLFGINIENLALATKLYIYNDNMEKRPITRMILDKSSGEIEIIFDCD